MQTPPGTEIDPVPDTSPPSGSTDKPALKIVAGARRGGNRPTLVRPNLYDYAPAIFKDPTTGTYRMWWCGASPTVGGDHIYYAEAQNLDGPWHAHNNPTENTVDDVFSPTYSLDDWDGQDVCDPSIVVKDGTYYMFYGGLPIDGSSQPMATAIGLATSSDGMVWSRAQATPILQSARSVATVKNSYGAGQPSVTEVEGTYYLAFTDTTGLGADPNNGAGIFVWRSTDVTFRSSVEELQQSGFVPLAAAAHTSYSILPTFNVDWAYSPLMQRFVLANDTPKETQVLFFDRNIQRVKPSFALAGATFDGPGLVTDPGRQLPSGAQCGAVPVDMFRAVADGTGRSGPYGWDLAHVGLDLLTNYVSAGCVPATGKLK